MHISKLLLSFGVLLLTGESLAAQCKNPPQRKEWRQLTKSERSSYLNAVTCLARKPDVTGGLQNATNLFQSFQATHSEQNGDIHWVGFFALWHRYFTATYERYLREVCGYKGAQPYWNWSLDASATDNSSMAIFETDIFDNDYGFGGNGKPFLTATAAENAFNLTGRTGGGCVQDGPFRKGKFFLNVGQPQGQSDCLRRDWIPWILNYFGRQSLVDHVESQPDYTSFARALENIPSFSAPNIHGSGHFGVGGVLGTLGNSAHSPGDPLFYLHHANLDRVLWNWQQKDLPARLHEVGGPIEPFDYSGQNVTLDFEINIGKLAGNATLEQLLNTQGDVLCYDYYSPQLAASQDCGKSTAGCG
ncbi:monooxygenase [Penicillium brasilianum]|uniref:Monooxygenase n=1 Tax=Penicillium brasilianum TaxID=104259 RepID=A0A1S9RAT3_PENBI|nr:monooxygenase [Penicillium brasilianum]